MNIGPKSIGSEKESSDRRQIPSEPKSILVLRMVSDSSQEPDRVFKFDKERIVLGSVVSADVRLTGAGVSPIHAVLELVGEKRLTGGVARTGVIFDLASVTGVFVNDKKVVTQELHKNDRIKIGQYQLKYNLEVLSPASEPGPQPDVTRESDGRVLFLDPREDLQPLLLQDEREIEDIFDFRPTAKRALEIVMSWCGTILDVAHFVDEKRVTIGNTRSNDFGIPPLLSSKEFPIVTKRRGEGFVLNLDTQMKGVIQQNGQLTPLDEVRSKAIRGPNGYEVNIGNNDFAKVAIGEVDFYFSYTAAPPRLKRRRIFERDPFFLKIMMMSMVMTLALLLTLHNVKLPQSVEAEQMPERIATILYQPEKFMQKVPPPVPKPVAPPQPKVEEKVAAEEPPRPTKKVEVKLDNKPKPVELKKPIPKVLVVNQQTQKPSAQPAKPLPPAAKASTVTRAAPKAEAKEGAGARAQGKEGSRGELNQKKTAMKVTQLERSSPNAGSTGANTASEVNEDGNVDLLKGAGSRIQNVLGNSAARLGDGGERLKGFGNFSTGGGGGLALSGNGQGGGGTADTTLGGVGRSGRGMGRVGTGMGAAGNGSGIVGAHTRVAIRSDGPEEAVVMGEIDQGAIEAVLAAHKDEFRLCYEREINAENPTLSGRVGVNFDIGASGRVSGAGIDSSSLKNHNAESCLLQVIRRIEFPKPQGGGVVTVKKTFTFNSVH